jgi:hypothetical protein
VEEQGKNKKEEAMKRQEEMWQRTVSGDVPMRSLISAFSAPYPSGRTMAPGFTRPGIEMSTGIFLEV